MFCLHTNKNAKKGYSSINQTLRNRQRHCRQNLWYEITFSDNDKMSNVMQTSYVNVEFIKNNFILVGKVKKALVAYTSLAA